MSTTDLICVEDYEKKALSLLDKRSGNYFAAGADDEQTIKENQTDFKRLRLRPRMLVDVSNVSMATTILGEKIDFPICIAPTARHKMAHPVGEIGTAKAAEEMGTCYCMSTYATALAADVGRSSPHSLKWFQLYVYKNAKVTETLIKRAEKAGFKALVVTVDFPAVSTKRRVIRDGYYLSPHLSEENLESFATHELQMADSITWNDLKDIISFTSLPVMVKGILTGEDAEEAIKAGCSAVYVSNHGGRNLDGVYSGIRALPEIVKAVNGRVEVYMDGGVRTGTDVLKALALGARAVFIGRPAVYGLAVGGEKGVKNVLTILRDELKIAMQLSGNTDVQRISRNLVIHESAIARL